MTIISRLGISAASLACGVLTGTLLFRDSPGRERYGGRATVQQGQSAVSPNASPLNSEKAVQAFEKRRSRWEEAREVLSRAAAGIEPEGDGFSTACAEIARRSRDETLGWYRRFVELGRYDKAQKVFHSILGSALCADVDYGELAVPLLAKCSSENVVLLGFIAGKQVQRNPEDFPDWARNVPAEFKGHVLEEILDGADYTGPAVRGIMSLLVEVPDSAERSKFQTRFWEGLFDNRPQETFEMAVVAITEFETGPEGPPLSALVAKWQSEDPRGLLVKLESLPAASRVKVLEHVALDNPKLCEQLKSGLAAP